MTYRIPNNGWVQYSYDQLPFLTLLHSAQDGDPTAASLVVLATLPIIFSLTSDEDEISDLILYIYENVLPKWTETYQWAGHAKRKLTWRLGDIRKQERRRQARGF